MDGRGKLFSQAPDVAGRVGAVLGDEIDERRSDHDTIRHLGNSLRLLGRANTEADRDREVSGALEAGDVFPNRSESCLLLARDARDGDVIEKPASAIEHSGKT